METKNGSGERRIFAQCQEVFFGERCSGGKDAAGEAIYSISVELEDASPKWMRPRKTTTSPLLASSSSKR